MIMKRIFTILLVLCATLSFAQKGSTLSIQEHFDSKAVVTHNNKAVTEAEVMLPGDWANVTEVAMYRWTNDGNPMGWVFGNNTYGAYGAGVHFTTEEEVEIVGAYFWVGQIGSGNADIKFCVYEFAEGAVGEEIACKTVALDQIQALTPTGATPSNYTNAFYVEFDEPVLVSGDFFVGVDASAVTFAAHGDGVGLVSGKIDAGGGGTGTAYIVDTTDGWTLASEWNEAVDLDLGIFPMVQEPSGSDAYSVIFNVDMTGVEGFDPATDKVYLTGSFTGWTEPGEDGSIEMTRVTSKEQAVYYEEGFEDWDSEEPSLLPEGWELFRTSALNDSPTTAPADKFWVANNPDSDPFGEGEPEIYVKTGEGSIVIGYTAPDFTWAVTPEINLPNADNLMLSYWPWYQHNADESWFSNYHVKIFADGAWVLLKSFIGGTSGEAANTFTSAVEFELDAYKGKSVKIAFIYEYTDGYQMAIDDIKIEGDEAAGEDLFYTATVEIEAGEIQYKYFKNAGWDGGEWAGEPNRVVSVSGDMTINDVWGEITSAEEIKPDASSTTLYPNPATYELNVQHSSRISEIRVFDITGRMVYNTAVNNLTTTKVDVSRFSNGVYILQVVAQDGITSKKFVKR